MTGPRPSSFSRSRSPAIFSVLEHANFTFGVEGVSRALLAQITRHRVASFSVASQRYINSNNMDFSIPEAVKNNINTARIFGDCMQTITSAYRDIHAYLMSESSARNMRSSSRMTA